MCNKSKVAIITFFSIVLFMSGMYPEDYRIHSSFAYIDSEYALVYIEQCDDVACNEKLCTVNQLGICDYACVEQGNHSGICGKLMRSNTQILDINLLDESFSKCYFSKDGLQLPELCSQSIVLHYIHNEDGKKWVSDVMP